MRKRILAIIMATLVGTPMFVSCSSSADDGVGLRPMDNTDDTFYFDTGSHTLYIEEGQTRVVTVERISDAFTYQVAPTFGLDVSREPNTNKLNLAANVVKQEPYVITITDQGKTATLNVYVTAQDAGWRNGVYTIENLDGDMTEEKNKDKDYVEIKAQGYTTREGGIEPAAAADRINITINGDIIKVTAKNQYDGSTPITFKVKNDVGEERTVKIVRVTKLWEMEGTQVIGLSHPTYVTQHSFDSAPTTPKLPYKATSIDGIRYTKKGATSYYHPAGFYYFNLEGLSEQTNKKRIAMNPIITRVDLNNVTNVSLSSFQGCTGLKELKAAKVTDIGVYAFLGTNIQSVELPAVVNIGFFSFANSGVKTMVIGEKLKELRAGALQNTTALTNLRIGVTDPSVFGDTGFVARNRPGISSSPYGFLYADNATTGARLSVPAAALSSWQSKFPWLAEVFRGGVQGY